MAQDRDREAMAVSRARPTRRRSVRSVGRAAAAMANGPLQLLTPGGQQPFLIAVGVLQSPRGQIDLGAAEGFKEPTHDLRVDCVGRQALTDGFSRAVTKIAEWCRIQRHDPVKEQHITLSQKLKGHDAYYGIIGNSRPLQQLRHAVQRVFADGKGIQTLLRTNASHVASSVKMDTHVPEISAHSL